MNANLKLDVNGESLLETMAEEPFKPTGINDFKKRLWRGISSMTEVSGAQLMVASLEALAEENAGIRSIAGHHGGAILPYYEFFTKSPLYSSYVHTPNEQIAGFMAKGLALGTGHVGVASVTSGPGGTNIITPFYDAAMDSVPMVVISGNVATSVKDSMAFQEAPIANMVKPVAKGVHYINKANDIPKILFDAFCRAAYGRPGPIWLDFPKDIQFGKVPPKEVMQTLENYNPPKDNVIRINGEIDELAKRISNSQRPALYVGGGVKSARAWNELRRLASDLGIPTTTTLMGKGLFPETDKLSLGMLGMHGTAYANYAINEADLLINVGARFDDRVTGNPKTFAKNGYIVHIDVDPRGIGPNGLRNPELTIKADAKNTLMLLNDAGIRARDLSAWHARIEELKKGIPLDYDHRGELLQGKTPELEFMKPQYAIEMIYRMTGGRHDIVADVGQHQMWAAQYYLAIRPRGFQTSGGAGTMGCSMAQALGAYLGKKLVGDDTPTSVIVGDESFNMNPQTLTLYNRLGANIKVFVIDNKQHDGTPGGMVNQWYHLVHNGTKLPVDGGHTINQIASGFGISNALANNDPRSVNYVVNKALMHSGPFVGVFKVDHNEMCLPMIPGGTSVDKIVTYQGMKAKAVSK